jgi:outer membrane protein TolC
MEADQQVAQAKSSKGINVCLEAEVGFYQTADNIKETYRNLKNNETVGLTLSLPIFDWGVGKGRVKMAEAEREMNRMQQQQTHASYMQELRSSVLQFNMQSSQYNNAQKAQDIAERRYDMVKRQFETGAATVTELNTAQQEAENAKGQYLRMQQGFWTEYYKLRRSTLYDWIDKKDLAVDVNTIINNHKTGHITW